MFVAGENESVAKQKLNEFTGADTHVKARKDRISQTPVEGVTWDGSRGVSNCYPHDKEIQKLLKKYKQEYVHYDRTGEPDFRPFAEVSTRISDMGAERFHNFSSSEKRVLETDWAKSKGLKTLKDFEEYRKEHNLTWHECSDGVTMLLIPTKVNSYFGHSGGVSENLAATTHSELLQDGLTRAVGKSVGVASLQANKTLVRAEDAVTDLKENISDTVASGVGVTKSFLGQYVDTDTLALLNQAGVDAATSAAVFSGVISIVENTKKVAAGEESSNEAIRQVAADVGGAAATAYVSGIASKVIADQIGGNISANDAAMLAVPAQMISKLVISFASGDISGEQFVQNVAETSAYMIAAYMGKNVGAFLGTGVGMIIGNALLPGVGGTVGVELGRMVGAVVGEMVSTIICAEVITSVRFTKTIEDRSKKMAAICRNAEREIRLSQERLRAIIGEENSKFCNSIEDGYQKIALGIWNNSSSQIQDGLATIGGLFGLNEEDFSHIRTTKSNLFVKRVVVLE